MNETAQRVVLIGGDGFVGSHLRRYLAGPDLYVPSRAEADLTDPATLERTLRAGDCVINAAGYANATDTSIAGRALFQSLNVTGVENLAAAAARCGAAQLIHLSSVAAMGRWYGVESVTEDMMRPDPLPYSASKLEGERILAGYARNLPVTVFRPTSVFGEGRGLARTLCGIVSRGVAPLPGGGVAKIPFTYIGNVAHAIALSIRNPRCFGQTFIVGDRQPYPFRSVIAAFAEALGVRTRIVPVPAPLAVAGALALEGIAAARKRSPAFDRWRLANLTNTIGYSPARFMEATGYEPPYSLEAAASRIAAWYQSAAREGAGAAH